MDTATSSSASPEASASLGVAENGATESADSNGLAAAAAAPSSSTSTKVLERDENGKVVGARVVTVVTSSDHVRVAAPAEPVQKEEEGAASSGPSLADVQPADSVPATDDNATPPPPADPVQDEASASLSPADALPADSVPATDNGAPPTPPPHSAPASALGDENDARVSTENNSSPDASSVGIKRKSSFEYDEGTDCFISNANMRKIAKLDPQGRKMSSIAQSMIAKSSEHFLSTLLHDAEKVTLSEKRHKIQYMHVAKAAGSWPAADFLKELLPER